MFLSVFQLFGIIFIYIKGVWENRNRTVEILVYQNVMWIFKFVYWSWEGCVCVCACEGGCCWEQEKFIKYCIFWTSRGKINLKLLRLSVTKGKKIWSACFSDIDKDWLAMKIKGCKIISIHFRTTWGEHKLNKIYTFN